VRRKYTAAGILILVIIGILIFHRYYGGHETPAGQPPLENLTPKNFVDLTDAFNAAKGNVRELVLLSPT
jgi:hypothetical protein